MLTRVPSGALHFHGGGVVASGHLSYEQPLGVADRVDIGWAWIRDPAVTLRS